MPLEIKNNPYTDQFSTGLLWEMVNGNGFQMQEVLDTETEVVEDVKIHLPRIKVGSNPLQASIDNPTASDFESGPGTEITFSSITGKNVDFRDTISPKKLRKIYKEIRSVGPSVDLKANPKLMNSVFKLIMASVKDHINKLHVSGRVGASGDHEYLKFYDGFTQIIHKSPDSNLVGTPVTITEDNVISEINELVKGVSQSVRSRPNLVLFCTYDIFCLYQTARANSQTAIPVTDIASNFMLTSAAGTKIRIMYLDNMPANYMFITLASKNKNSNLVQGVWTLKDFEKILMFKLSPGDMDYRFLARMCLGVGIKSAECVWYKPGVAKGTDLPFPTE